MTSRALWCFYPSPSSSEACPGASMRLSRLRNSSRVASMLRARNVSPVALQARAIWLRFEPIRARSCRSIALNCARLADQDGAGQRLLPDEVRKRDIVFRSASLDDRHLVLTHARRNKQLAFFGVGFARPSASAEGWCSLSHVSWPPPAGFQGVPP